jgi:hypothetical protein
MDAALQFFVSYAPLIYGLLVVGLLVAIRRLVQARRETRESIYGLERELSHKHMSQAITALSLIIFFGLGEFFLTVFLVPALPASSVIATPTVNPLITPTVTLSPVILQTLGALTPEPTATVEIVGCIPGQIMITSPEAGEELHGKVTLQGSANIPNFGFYKYEFAPRDTENWSTILAVREVVQDGKLGDWDTSLLTPGDYFLRLVVTDNQATVLPACVVPVTVLAP